MTARVGKSPFRSCAIRMASITEMASSGSTSEPNLLVRSTARVNEDIGLMEKGWVPTESAWPGGRNPRSISVFKT